MPSFVCSTSATSRSSPTSTTASRRWPTASSSAAAGCPTARWRSRCSTRWTSSASAASRSRRRPPRSTTARATAQTYQLNLIDTPGPRRLLLRGVALAGGLRRRAAGGRCVAGRRGADGRQLLHRDRAGRRGRAGAEQDRPAVGRPRARDRRDRGHHRHPGARTRCACSAKTGEGVDDILEAVIARIPPPKGDPDAPLQALIIDSWFDNYVGVVMLVRVVDGTLRPQGQDPADGDRRDLHCASRSACSRRSRVARDELSAGEVGFVIAGIKELQRREGRRHGHARGDARRPQPLPGFKEIKPQVFAGPLPGRVERVRGAARRAREAEAQRRLAALRARSPRRRWASASAAASSACCTWTSCRSGSSASTTWT